MKINKTHVKNFGACMLGCLAADIMIKVVVRPLRKKLRDSHEQVQEEPQIDIIDKSVFEVMHERQ